MSAAKEVTRRSRRAKGYKQRLVDDLREHVRNGSPHGLTFKPTAGMSKEQVARLQAALNDAYELWAESWIYPWIDQIEAALHR